MQLRHCRIGLIVLVMGFLSFGGSWAAAAPTDELHKIKLPSGFKISVYADVPNARSMAVMPSSRMLVVGTRRYTLWAVFDTDGDYDGDEIFPLMESLNAPTGVAYRDGMVYVAEQHRVRRAEFDENRPMRMMLWKVVKGGLLDNRHHGTRGLAFGPDGRLYVSLGVPCNICMPNSPDDTIISMNPDGSDERIFASGIRNSVGMDFQPSTGHLFFTDNGADSMGDDIPPDELNRADREGLHFGYPYYGGGKERTADFRSQDPPQDVTFPAVELQAHTASLGVHFYRGDMFPAEYKGSAFIAQHGSWNRSEPTGYRVVRVSFDADGNPTGKEIFAEGWLQPGGPWGRPNGIAELDDGSLLVSDDAGGVIYRITYEGG